MKRKSITITKILGIGLFSLAITVSAFAKNPVVEIKTNMGSIKVVLFKDKAPISVKNFLRYVKAKKYDNTIFHRVIPNFMIQGGGFTKKMAKVATYAPIKNEAGNGLSNTKGTLAMARTMVVDSASNQFFINVQDNASLNHRDNSARGYGYAVFGKVIGGMKIVEKIKKVKTGNCGPHQNCPVQPVIIKSIRLK